MTETALVIIDIQNDYFPGGALELVEPTKAAANARMLLEWFRASDKTIIHIQHENHSPNLQFMLPGTKGQEIHTEVQPARGEELIVKHFPSAFCQTNLEEILKGKGVQKLMLAGMMTHMCVSATARAAMELGFQVAIVQDACATRELEFRGKAIAVETVHQTALAEVAMFSEILDTQQAV